MDESWKSYVRAMSHYNTDEWRLACVGEVERADRERWRRCIEMGFTAEDLAEVGIEPPKEVPNDK